MNEANAQSKVTVKRLGRGRYLHSIIPILDSSGEVIHRVIKPLMVELRLRDIVQILVGSAILAIPIGFTEEVWNLGERLSGTRVGFLAGISVGFIALFVYMNFYHSYFKGFVSDYIKRVLAIYILSLVVVATLLTIIDQCPWGIDNVLAVKRVVIATFPASLSATVTDALK